MNYDIKKIFPYSSIRDQQQQAIDFALNSIKNEGKNNETA